MKYGYARVSKDEQNPAMQLAALEAAGCRQTFTDEGVSGAVAKRPALTRCLKALQPGDTLTVWKLDRLGRSMRDLLNVLHELQGRGVEFQSIVIRDALRATRPRVLIPVGLPCRMRSMPMTQPIDTAESRRSTISP